MTNIIRWLVNLKADKAILAILLIAISAMAGVIVHLNNTVTLKNAQNLEYKQEVVEKTEEIVDCQEQSTLFIKELYLNVLHIENKTKIIDSTNRAVEAVAMTNNKKIKKLLKNEKK